MSKTEIQTIAKGMLPATIVTADLDRATDAGLGIYSRFRPLRAIVTQSVACTAGADEDGDYTTCTLTSEALHATEISISDMALPFRIVSIAGSNVTVRLNGHQFTGTQSVEIATAKPHALTTQTWPSNDESIIALLVAFAWQAGQASTYAPNFPHVAENMTKIANMHYNNALAQLPAAATVKLGSIKPTSQYNNADASTA